MSHEFDIIVAGSGIAGLSFALKVAAESGSERDIKKARALFLKLKPGDRRAAMTMLDD